MKLSLRLFLLTICLLYISTCGINNVIKPKDEPKEGFISSLTVQNNILSFVTQDSTFAELTYYDRLNSDDMFRGWTAGSAALEHTYLLPVTDVSITYQMRMSVKNTARVTMTDTLFTFVSTASDTRHLKVHFINVQQGDSILIESPDMKNMIIDGGYGTLRREDWQGGGVPLALNYLIDKNITHLDYIIESHRHEDHWGGLADITNSHITHDMYISVSNPRDFFVGATLNLGNEVHFNFYNLGYPPTYNGRDLNNTSIVLKATHGDVEFLFTGDILRNVQNWMIAEGFDLSVDVLKVPHHGSSANGSSDVVFLDATLNQFAKIAILSFGEANTYNHPHDLRRFSAFHTYGTNRAKEIPAGSQQYYDNSGSIVVYSDKRMVFIQTESDISRL